MAAPFLEANQVRKLKPEIRFEFGDWSISGITELVYNGSFRENIQSFLGEFGQTKKYSIAAKPIWYMQICGPNGIMLPLYIIEEIVEKSRNPFCDYCKFTGWGHHFVSKRRYHIILPQYDEWDEDLMYDRLGHRFHVFYGLIHCNGYGHLICINGVNENFGFFSDYDAMNFSAYDAMNLWDWICSILRPRAISVCDVMDVKLLHVLAFGKSWYGKWGYLFRGEKYETAVKLLRSFSLYQIEIDLSNTNSGRELRRVVNKYRKVRNISMVTIGDLLQFMLAFEARARVDSDSLVTSLAKSCSCSTTTIEEVLNVILNLLEHSRAENGEKGSVSMKELRDEASRYSDNYEMIDAVLKSMRFLKMEGRMIRCSTNSSIEESEFEILDEDIREEELGVFPYYGMKFDCRWPEKRIRHAAGVIVKILNDGNRNAQSWEELYGKATESIDDLKLIAFVLNSMDRAMFGNQIVSRTQHLATRRTQFSVRDIVSKHDMISILEAGEDVDEDVLYFYTTLLSAYDDTHPVSLAIQDILESKQCVKEWPHKQDTNQLLAFSCQVVPRRYGLQKEFARPLSPGEVIHVPPHTTKRELKIVVQSALRKTYCAMKKITVEKIVGFEKLGNDKPISCILLPGYTKDVPVEESGLTFETELLYEDGERLVECDICQAVHTTSCIGYKAAKYTYICTKCKV